jgi:hypothetical protein
MGNSTSLKYQSQIPELTTLVDKLMKQDNNQFARYKINKKIVTMYNRSYQKKLLVEKRLEQLRNAYAYGLNRRTNFSGAIFACEMEQVMECDSTLQYEINSSIEFFKQKLAIIDDNISKLFSLYKRLSTNV